jgi:hypothetical protein
MLGELLPISQRQSYQEEGRGGRRWQNQQIESVDTQEVDAM